MSPEAIHGNSGESRSKTNGNSLPLITVIGLIHADTTLGFA
jgi:hypothetical protein